MTDETISATTIINAPAEAIFAVLADPAKHAAIDGTGWVCEPLDLTCDNLVRSPSVMNGLARNAPDVHVRVTDVQLMRH